MGAHNKENMTARIKDKRKERGFTLLEILIAISILMVGFLAVAGMQTMAIRGNAFSRDTTEATTWAKDKVEHLMSLPYGHADVQDVDGDGTGEDANSDGIDDDGGNFGLDDTVGAADGSDTSNPVYTIYWNVAVDYPIQNTKAVRVIVTWQDRAATRKVSLTNIKSQL